MAPPPECPLNSTVLSEFKNRILRWPSFHYEAEIKLEDEQKHFSEFNFNLHNNLCKRNGFCFEDGDNDRFRVNLYTYASLTRSKSYRQEKKKRKSIVPPVVPPKESKCATTLNRQNQQNNTDKNCTVVADNDLDDYIAKRNLSMTMTQSCGLKDQRDAACTLMKEASQVLKVLNRKSDFGNWDERLLAEKVLLENEQRYNLTMGVLSNDYQYITTKDVPIGKITIGGITFNLEYDVVPKPHEADFFVVLLSNGTEVKTTTVQRQSSNGSISFEDTITFDIHCVQTFQIKMQVFHICLKDLSKLGTILRRSRISHPTIMFNHKNVHTMEMEQNEVLKSSFCLSAKATITSSNYTKKTWVLKLAPGSTLANSGWFYVKLDCHATTHSGFLTLGRKVSSSSATYWDRLWCVLKGKSLRFYQSPQEESCGSDDNNNAGSCVLSIDLMKCKDRQIKEASMDVCPRTRSLLVDLGGNGRYFLRADDVASMRDWQRDLNLILHLVQMDKDAGMHFY